MRTECIEVYKFDELTEVAQSKAIENFRVGHEYPWGSENESALDAFAEEFGLEIITWAYGMRDKGISFRCNHKDEVKDLHGARLLSYLHNNFTLFSPKYYGKLFDCEKDEQHPIGKEHKKRYSKALGETYNCPFTGYWIDNELMHPIWEFITSKGFNEHTTFRELMEECLNSWVDACDRDFESSFTDEHLREDIEANEWEFTEEGEMF